MTAIAIAAAAVATFNLVCTGTLSKSDGSKAEFAETFGIDLDARRYCRGACLATEPIAEVGERDIVLVNQAAGADVSYIAISRESGIYVSMWSDGDERQTVIAQCAAEPFTGFPAIRF